MLIHTWKSIIPFVKYQVWHDCGLNLPHGTDALTIHHRGYTRVERRMGWNLKIIFVPLGLYYMYTVGSDTGATVWVRGSLESLLNTDALMREYKCYHRMNIPVLTVAAFHIKYMPIAGNKSRDCEFEPLVGLHSVRRLTNIKTTNVIRLPPMDY